MTSFSPEQVEHMRQLFAYVDKDGSGSIDAEELGSVMHELGKDLTPEELSALMNQLDADGNGSVEFEEFLEGMGKWFLQPDGGAAAESTEADKTDEWAEKARAIFDAVDTDGSGLIDASELKEALKGMGRDATDKDVADLMKKLNVVGNEIDFETFLNGFHQFAQQEEEEERGHSFSEEQVNKYREIFKMFDRDGSGTIDLQEMRSVLNELGKKVNNRELERLMSDLDNDGSGEIDFEEFLKGMERLDQLATQQHVFETEDEDTTQKYEKMAGELKEAKRQLRAAQNKHNVFQQEVQYWETTNQKNAEELQKKTQELDRIRKDYKSSQSLKEANKELSAEVESLRAQLQKARDQEDKMKRKNTALNNSIQLERESLIVTKGQLEAKEEELDKVRTLVKNMSKQSVVNEEFEEHKRRYQQIELELHKVRETNIHLSAVQESHKLLQEQHCEYQTLLDQARSKITMLENTVDEYAQMGHTAAVISNTPDESMFSLANEMEQQGKVDVVEAELKGIKVEVLRLREEKSAKENEIARFESELKNTRVETLRLREEKTAKEAEANITRSELNTLREETKAKDEALQGSRRELASLKGENSVMESEIAGLKKDKHGLEARIAQLEARVRELEGLLAAREEELRSLRGQLQDEQKIREEEEKLKKELIEKNVRLTSELSDLNDLSSSFVSSSTEVLSDEDASFISYINENLKDDVTVSHLLPIGKKYAEVAAACLDGVVLSKLINKAIAGTIDERVLKMRPRSKVDITQNHNLCVNSAMAIGATVLSSFSQSLFDGQVPPIISFVTEVTRIGLLSSVNFSNCRELIQLKEDGETTKQFMNLLPEQLLFRWVNYHLKRAEGKVKPITNLTDDVRDGTKYTVLLHQLFPESCGLEPLSESDTTVRVGKVLENASKAIGATNIFLTPNGLLDGNAKLNLLFVASLFRTRHGMQPLKEENKKIAEEAISVEFDDEGSREERAFRFWMQSLGVSVRNITDDVGDGLAILQVFDKIAPGIVDWKSVNTNRARMNAFNKLENCNYCVKLGKQLQFSMVGIGGKDFVDGNRKLILALFWQSMRHHIFSILKQLKSGGKDVTEDDMISWANGKVKASGRSTSMKDFRDKSLGDSLFLIDLLNAIDPTLVDYNLVTPGDTPENKQLNAKYAINIARLMGCCVFLLWEDIVEVKSKMILTFVGTLMSVDR